MWEVPLNDVLWYPVGYVTSSYLVHFYNVIFYHLVPALIVDGLLKLIGQKPRQKKLWEYTVRRISFCLGFRLLKIQRKIYIANMALQYFITRDWTFINDKSVELQKYLLPKDVEAFSFGDQDIDPYQYFKQSTYGSRQYLLKEDISTLPQAIKHSRKYWVPNNISKPFSVIIFFQNVCGAPFCYSSLVLSGNMANIQIWLTRSN